jgi:hypothetical protein
MRRIIAAALTATVAAAIAFTVLSLDKGRSPLPTVTVAEQLQRCTEVPDVTGCISDVTVASLRNDTFDDLLAASELLEQTNGAFVASCHEAFHSIGSRAIEQLGSAAAAVSKVAYPLCKGGLAHGVLEAFAVTDHNESEWVAIVAACAALIENEPGRGGECAHGVGHALVISDPQDPLSEHLSRCLQLTDAHQSDRVDGPLSNHCAFGTMMGVYAPLDADMKEITEPAHLAQICGEFVDRPELVDGCMRGSGYSLGENLRFYADDPYAGVDMMLAACTSTPTADVAVGKRRTADSCVATVLQAAQPVFKLPLVEHAQLCDRLTAGRGERITAACLFEARTGLTAGQHAELLALRPALRDLAEAWGAQYR